MQCNVVFGSGLGTCVKQVFFSLVLFVCSQYTKTRIEYWEELLSWEKKKPTKYRSFRRVPTRSLESRWIPIPLLQMGMYWFLKFQISVRCHHDDDDDECALNLKIEIFFCFEQKRKRICKRFCAEFNVPKWIRNLIKKKWKIVAVIVVVVVVVVLCRILHLLWKK